MSKLPPMPQIRDFFEKDEEPSWVEITARQKCYKEAVACWERVCNRLIDHSEPIAKSL